MTTAKYTVTAFPGLFGHQFHTNWWMVARLVASWRHVSLRYGEVRLKNNETGEERVW